MSFWGTSKKILYVCLPVALGAVLGVGLFQGVTFFRTLGLSPIAFVAGDNTQKGKGDTQSVGDSNFFYKPLAGQDVEIPKEGKAVFADLDAMTVTLYENGNSVKEFPIKSKGKPGSFWETPRGEYRALTKEENHFSSIGQVWMPYSIGFFGNFFIHGWPSYPSGKSVPEGFSGGCIRLSTEDAKNVYEFTDAGTPILVVSDRALGTPSGGYLALRHAAPPRLSGAAFMAADLDNNYTFLEHDRDVQRPIASITKLMTAAISLEAINQDADVVIDTADLDINGDTGHLEKNEIFTAKNLLAPLLLSSSNDAAYALARISGVSHFVDLMNQKAKALGLSHTHFTDPSGLEMTNISTPEDQLYFLKYIRDVRAPILEMSSKRSSSLATNKATHTWYNFNWKSNDSEFVGGKIGYLDSAGKTIVALFRVPMSEFETRDIGVVVLDSQDQEGDVRGIMKWIKSNFVYGAVMGGSKVSGAPIETQHIQKPSDEEYSMMFVGDIMMDRSIRALVEKKGSNYLYPFANVADFLSTPTITFANLEGPISDVGSDHGSIYSFRMDPAVTKALYDVGIDIVSVANNHMGDWGREAFEDTLRRLRRAHIAFTGGGWNTNEAHDVTVLERAGMRIGFVGFSDVGPNWMRAGDALSGIAIASEKDVADAVRQARDKVDILVVSFHFGDEYQTTSNARQKLLAHAAIDAGARVVIGTHPHVAEEVESYNGGVIAYSLGNFIFDQAFSEDTKKALALKINMKGSHIEHVEKIPLTFNETFQPSTAE